MLLCRGYQMVMCTFLGVAQWTKQREGHSMWLFAKSRQSMQNNPIPTISDVSVLLPRQCPFLCTGVELIHLVHRPLRLLTRPCGRLSKRVSHFRHFRRLFCIVIITVIMKVIIFLSLSLSLSLCLSFYSFIPFALHYLRISPIHT